MIFRRPILSWGRQQPGRDDREDCGGSVDDGSPASGQVCRFDIEQDVVERRLEESVACDGQYGLPVKAQWFLREDAPEGPGHESRDGEADSGEQDLGRGSEISPHS